MFTPELITIIIIFLAASIVGFDVYLAVDNRDGNTYSEIIRAAGRKWIALIILISFAMGLLAGHWWWA